MSDRDLAVRVAEGDEDALAALYDRHVDALHDFAARMLRDRDAAADVVQGTFLKAWEVLGSRPGSIANIRAWLFTVARNAALDEMRRRRREEPDDPAVLDLTAVDTHRLADPADAAGQQELAALVSASVAALGAKDRTLFDLHVRQGLSADELAESLSLRKGAVYTRLSRLRDAMEEAIGAVLLARHGRRDCPALDAALSALGQAVPAAVVRGAVRSHLRGCADCRAARSRLSSPVALLGAMAPLSPAAEVRDDLWRRISEVTAMGAVRSPLRRRRRRAFVLFFALVVLLVLVVVAVAVLARSGRNGGPVDRGPGRLEDRVGGSTGPVVVAPRGTPPPPPPGPSSMATTGGPGPPATGTTATTSRPAAPAPAPPPPTTTTTTKPAPGTTTTTTAQAPPTMATSTTALAPTTTTTQPPPTTSTGRDPPGRA